MRIPSSLTEDNLYSRHNRRTKGKSPHRQLMRLALAMILVVAVMRQAGNPRIYEAFFPPSSADIASQAQAVAPLSTARPSANGVLSVSANGTLNIDVDELLDARSEKMLLATANQLDQMLVVLGDEQAAKLMTELGQRRVAIRAPIDPGADDSSERIELPVLSAEWTDRLDAAFAQTGQPADDPIEPLDWTAAPAIPLLQSALDRWAIARVDPAALWKGADTLGFYRLLEDDPSRRPDDTASRTSVISLVQQPDVYLRRRVVLPASVARVIRRPAAKNPFGVEQYWEVWLRPRDGSERPFILFTREVSTAIGAIGADSALTDGPQVWIDGVFLKRIAYQSTLGRELAPAIVGTLFDPSSASSNLPVAASSPSPMQGWLLVAFAALIGISAAALLFFQSGKAIARTRALRQKLRPPAPPFLASLEHLDRRDGEPGEHLS